VSEINLSIDGISVSVPAGTNLVKAAAKIGKAIPHFCYHPGLTVVGQCRMCFVEVEGMPKLATACSTMAMDNMKVHTQSEKVKAGQNATLEFTLLNHPLDCPICDRGGECKLQDYTYEFGPPRSRMEDDKVLRDKHKPISEQIVLDQERCILCTRCVRFSSEVDGKAEIVVNNRGNANVVDVFEGTQFTSAFSGNVVDLCPVGALTAQDFRFAARPWELKTHDALCTGCAMGCNVTIDTKHRHPGIVRPDKRPPSPKIVRLMPRDNLQVNTWWMCDKGRWGYHFHNNEAARLESPMLKRTKESALQSVSLKEIQKYFEEASSGQTWEFWVEDSAPHEEIAWAKELRSSWIERGRKVAPLNDHPMSVAFLAYWQSRAAASSGASQIDWSKIKSVASPISLDELERRVPILKLKLDQARRKQTLAWTEYKNLGEIKADATTLLLLSAPKSEAEVAALAKISPDQPQMILWSNANSRGLVNEGIVPLEVLSSTLHGRKAQGPIFVFGQTTQNLKDPAFAEYLATAPLVVVADSFASIYSEQADIVLPLTPLYETRASLTNIENLQQVSPGVQVHHPNHKIVERGGDLVAGSLRLL
jgi:NADH dehydrogenase/NADH:ubiquinone oxidoreductase subunit G